MKKKRFFATALVAALAVGTLAGCGNKDSEENDNTPTQSADGAAKEITLKVWCPQNQIDTGIMEQQQSAFAAEHPEWKIKWENNVVGEDKCQDEVLKDVAAAADVFMFASDQLSAMVEAGALAQLGGTTEAMVKDEMDAAVVDTVTKDGKIYGIPFTHNTFFMFYDKTLLDESDITSLEKIMAKDTASNVYNFYFESSGGWKLGCYYYGAGLSVFGPSGGDLSAGVDWNNSTGIAVTNYLIDLINNPKCAYDGEISVSELAESHRLAAWFTGSWDYDLYKGILGDDLGIAVIPTFNPNGTDYQLKGFYGSKVIGVNSHSQNMAAAVAFAAYLGNEANQLLRYEKSAQIPTNVKAASQESVQADEVAAIIIKEVANASVAQPDNSIFSARYWNYAGAIATEIRSGEINKDNVQAKMDAFVQAMTAE